MGVEFQIPNLGLPTQESPPEPNNSNSPESETQIPSLGNEFLSKIPDQDQAIVAKYIKDWDAGVTKRFQEIHDQYKPYKDLGEIDQIQQATEIWSLIRQNPVAFHQQLQETIDELRQEGLLDVEIDQMLGTDLDGQNDQSQFDPNDYEDPRDAQIAQLTQQLDTVMSRIDQTEQQRQDDADIAQLDKLMKDLHNEHGEFDDDYFLIQLQRGNTPEQAIEAWNNLVEGAVNRRPRKNPPLLMTGAGNVPGAQVDPSKLSAEDRIKYITASLEQANRG